MNELKYNMPEDEYFAHPAQSNSKLKLLGKDVVYSRWLRGFTGTSQAKEFGSLVHCAVLEPDAMEERYREATATDRRTKAYKEEQAQASLDGVTLVTSDDWQAAIMCRDNVAAHPTARELFANGRREVSAFWQSANGVDCKCRMDWLSIGDGRLVDLKTARGGSAKDFAKSCGDYGYHYQQAFYTYGAQCCGVDVDDFVFVVVEKGTWEIACYRLSAESIMRAQQQVVVWLDAVKRYQDSVEEGRPLWTGYPQEIVTIDVPGWA